MNEAEPGMGSRSRIFARCRWRPDPQHQPAGPDRGLLRREPLLGDDQPDVFGGLEPELNSWLLTPYYDVRISASIREPDEFDPYALRQRVTKLLVERFGLEIHVNGKCQPPCGRWDKRRDDRPL